MINLWKNKNNAIIYNNNFSKIIEQSFMCGDAIGINNSLEVEYQWSDVDLITDWFCVDDNSSKEDREFMTSTYQWIDYYMKTPGEKGHRSSMNIIWNKLYELKKILIFI